MRIIAAGLHTPVFLYLCVCVCYVSMYMHMKHELLQQAFRHLNSCVRVWVCECERFMRVCICTHHGHNNVSYIRNLYLCVCVFIYFGLMYACICHTSTH